MVLAESQSSTPSTSQPALLNYTGTSSSFFATIEDRARIRLKGTFLQYRVDVIRADYIDAVSRHPGHQMRPRLLWVRLSTG